MLSAQGMWVAESAPPRAAAIAFDQLGAKVAEQYEGEGLAVTPPRKGARLRCVFQRLEGEVTAEGLRLVSTERGKAPAPFRVVADYVGRDGGAMVALPERGRVVCAGERARYLRPGLVEEYTVSGNGVRQDFVVSEPPPGGGRLRVELRV